jgi:small subunit ribosomal protein S20
LPNIKSAKKRVKTNLRDEARNRSAKSTMKSAVKRTQEAIANGDAEASKSQVRSTQALIGRTAKRGIIHKNKAARLQSRLMRKANEEKKSGEA